MRLSLLPLLIAASMVASFVYAAGPDVGSKMHIDPRYVQKPYSNPDGSCVLLSCGENGMNNNVIQWTTLPFDTVYGPAVRGGSGPSRVGAAAAKRGVPIWNVTGVTTKEWAKYSVRTGRFAAIGFFGGHFQTLYGYEPSDPSGKPWIILNNWNSPDVQRYSEAEFDRLHAASGHWIVVPQRPTSVPPVLTNWWE